MAINIKWQEGSHWYQCRDNSGKPQHDADLRIARKELLYPSISRINKDEFKNEHLEKYKLEQLMEAAGSNFRQPHEDLDAYCQRIYELSLQHAKNASDFGSALHDAIEHYPQYPLEPTLHPWLDKFSVWYNDNVEGPLHREKVLFDHSLAIAGRCDLIAHGKGKFAGQVIMPDYKTQGVKADKKGRKKAAFYDSWVRQLAFYAVTYAKEVNTFPDSIPTCISMVFDSAEPSEPYVRVWEKEEVISAYEDVVIAAYRWFKQRNYWPHPSGPIQITTNVEMPI